jgi:hypothetical protein
MKLRQRLKIIKSSWVRSHIYSEQKTSGGLLFQNVAGSSPRMFYHIEKFLKYKIVDFSATNIPYRVQRSERFRFVLFRKSDKIRFEAHLKR